MEFSIDLRTRVVESVENGMHINNAVILFKVSRRVIYEWLELKKKTGALNAKRGYQKGHSHKIKDWDQFKKFALENQQNTADQMIVKWENLTNIKVSNSVMLRALHKIGFTFKKKHLITRKQVKKNVNSF
jgi:transposase